MKSARQEKILELIREHEIDTQEELAARLLNAGFKVTQATVSRDIRALNLTKIASGDGRSRYQALHEPQPPDPMQRYLRLLREAVVQTSAGQNLVVIRTVPGMAMGAAAALDALEWKEILGCIAGDDTIFCACEDAEGAKTVLRKLRKEL